MALAVDVSPDQAQQIIYSTLRTTFGLPDAISKIITAQSGHETAGWTSNVYREFSNCFGYGYTGGGNYKDYNTIGGIEQSVSDVVGWLNRHIPNFQDLDPDQYAQALKDNGYYTDNETNYAQGIWNYLNDNLQITAGIGLAGVVGIFLLVYILLKK